LEDRATHEPWRRLRYAKPDPCSTSLRVAVWRSHAAALSFGGFGVSSAVPSKPLTETRNTQLHN